MLSCDSSLVHLVEKEVVGLLQHKAAVKRFIPGEMRLLTR